MEKKQWEYIISRGLEYTLTFFLILIINFFLPRIMPGGPLLSIYGGQNNDLPVVIDEQTKYHLMEYYNLNDPLHIQFVNYIIDAAHFNFGYSIFYNVPVIDIIWGRLPWTLLLMGTALLVSTLIGIWLGLESAWKRDTKFDNILLVTIPALKSIPTFFLGALMIFIFGYVMDLFPVSGAVTHYMSYDGLTDKIGDIISHLILPMLCLVAFEMPGTYMLVRNICVQQTEKPYVLMATARGLKQNNIKKHVLINSIVPVVHQIAAMLGFMVGGAVFVETVFAYPGMGMLVYNSFIERDYPMLQGVFIFISLCVLACNYAADIICSYIDRRIGLD